MLPCSQKGQKSIDNNHSGHDASCRPHVWSGRRFQVTVPLIDCHKNTAGVHVSWTRTNVSRCSVEGRMVVNAKTTTTSRENNGNREFENSTRKLARTSAACLHYFHIFLVQGEMVTRQIAVIAVDHASFSFAESIPYARCASWTKR